MADQRLRRDGRIGESRTFEQVFKQAARGSSKHLLAYLMPNDLPQARLGLSVSRRTGGAVVRNRIKRRLREIFRKRRQEWQKLTTKGSSGFDLVIRPKAGAGECTYKELDVELCKVIERLLHTAPPRATTKRHPKGRKNQSGVGPISKTQ